MYKYNHRKYSKNLITDMIGY